MDECKQAEITFLWDGYNFGPRPQDRVQQLEMELKEAHERFAKLEEEYIEMKLKLDVAQQQVKIHQKKTAIIASCQDAYASLVDRAI